MPMLLPRYRSARQYVDGGGRAPQPVHQIQATSRCGRDPATPLAPGRESRDSRARREPTPASSIVTRLRRTSASGGCHSRRRHLSVIPRAHCRSAWRVMDMVAPLLIHLLALSVVSVVRPHEVHAFPLSDRPLVSGHETDYFTARLLSKHTRVIEKREQILHSLPEQKIITVHHQLIWINTHTHLKSVTIEG
jgi:hypothetical protein